MKVLVVDDEPQRLDGARRECRTQREWDDIRQQSAKDTDKMQGNRGIAAPGKQ